MSRHPLLDILDQLKSDTRFDFTLVEKYEGKLMRLKCRTPNIWVMVASEDGSMLDRWAHDGGAAFVKYTEDDLAKGPEHNAKALIALAETEQEKQKLNVLVAEDNLINRMVIEGLLKRFDMYPDFCENGVETVTQLTSSVKTYDVIFMDCEMPEMDGFEATLRIREWEAEKAIKPIPIIALTAHVESSHRQKVFQVGMNYYLSKPITLEKLRESLENINLM